MILFSSYFCSHLPEIESKDCHPCAECQGEEREEDGEEGDPRQALGEEGEAERGREETHKDGVQGQVRRHARKPPKREIIMACSVRFIAKKNNW